tara:strand:- start:262 stop:1257 length:996 start_codon:yes stop_codon:yes gene_type:complete
VSRLEGKKVLVTGADGFIGSHLVERLVKEGAKVRALAQYNSFGSYGWLDSVEPQLLDDVERVHGDVRDFDHMLTLLGQCDTVYHLAALIAIPYSYKAVESYVETNIRGTLNVLTAAARSNVYKVVSTSTSEVYGTPSTIPITLDHPLQAQSPYAASKIAADQMCLAYGASFGQNVCVLRPFNTYGPRQSLRAVIPSILLQMLSGSENIEIGSTTTERDFSFVADTVDGFIKIGVVETEPGEVIQLGTGSKVSIGEVVELCRKITGCQAPLLETQERLRPEKSEVRVLLADASSAHERLEWRPSVELVDGLRATSEWLASTARVGEPTRFVE